MLSKIRSNENPHPQYYLFVQYLFFDQWYQLKKYANDFHMKIVGDMPMYVDYHSIDVWSHSHLFRLDSHTMNPTVVSGSVISSRFSYIEFFQLTRFSSKR